MLRRTRDEGVEVSLELGLRLPGRCEQEVEGDVGEAGVARGRESRPSLTAAMRAAESLQCRIGEGLDADREPVHARVAKRREARALRRTRIHLERDLDTVLEAGTASRTASTTRAIESARSRDGVPPPK